MSSANLSHVGTPSWSVGFTAHRPGAGRLTQAVNERARPYLWRAARHGMSVRGQSAALPLARGSPGWMFSPPSATTRFGNR